MAPATRSSTLPERSIGTLNKLPIELRTEVFRHLLSTAYTAVSYEVAVGRDMRNPTRSFDLYPNILRVSKWLNEEANRVLYDENLWVQVAFKSSGAALDGSIGLHTHLKRRTPMSHISLPRWGTASAPINLALDIRIADNPGGTNLHEVFDKILLPASQLSHFVALLHSLMCSTHQDDPDNFGLRSSVEISVGKLKIQNMSYNKLLKPFEGLYGFKKVKIQTQGRRDLQIRTLEAELRRPDINFYAWGVEMYHLYEEAMVYEEAIVLEKQEAPYTLVRDYYLNLVELMRAPCDQVIMKDLSPGALQEIYRLRWIVRIGLVRHEFYLSMDPDPDLFCITGWR